nr:CARDB domain-containing protein [Rhabdochromatium marinum]
MCTGGLVNDTDDTSEIPYFLTANHCIADADTARTVETYFHYQTSACGGGCPRTGLPDTIGAELLDTSLTDDHSFLRLNETPGGDIWYLGWTPSPVYDIENLPLYRISHPEGSPQAYSTHRVWNRAPFVCSGLRRGSFIYSHDEIGSTEGGSSGSPVLNVDAQVVGQLFGACGDNLNNVCDSESNATVDGAFASYFDRIKSWLDPDISQGPDLIVTSVTSPSTGVVGGQIDVRSTVKNQGDAAAGPSTLGYYLSTDAVITLSDIDTEWDCAVAALDPGDTWPCAGSIILPADIAPGTYYFGAYADKDAAVAESDASNNARAAANPIVIMTDQDPELVTHYLDASSETIEMASRPQVTDRYLDYGGLDRYEFANIEANCGGIWLIDHQASTLVWPAGLTISAAVFASDGAEFSINGCPVRILGTPALFEFEFAGVETRGYQATARLFGASIPAPGAAPVSGSMFGTIQADGNL